MSKPDPSAFCNAIDEWAGFMIDATRQRVSKEAGDQLDMNWRDLRLKIEKSCLLDRVLYNGEKPSRTPCPVHQGLWSGCHIGWPGQKWNDGRPVEESSQCREWYDAGCRCFLHSCGCTTGWNPDEHCGCGVKP